MFSLFMRRLRVGSPSFHFYLLIANNVAGIGFIKSSGRKLCTKEGEHIELLTDNEGSSTEVSKSKVKIYLKGILWITKTSQTIQALWDEFLWLVIFGSSGEINTMVCCNLKVIILLSEGHYSRLSLTLGYMEKKIGANMLLCNTRTSCCNQGSK